VIRNGEDKTKSYSHNINEKELNEIIKNIELAKSDNSVVEAFNGEAWEFVQYENGNVLWERKLGYIYGIEPLESICDMLHNLVKNESDVFVGDEMPQRVYGVPFFDKKDSKKCPYCNSTELWEYLYGEPAYDYDRDKYVLGGCEITGNQPIYKCKKCGKDIYPRIII
jgi:DNA-directed RNA polymerase subunit RPC12/RpoP